jgi:uncharacterized protein (TIGR00299 family) protein
MRTAYFDCFSGISGDMTLGALIACGVDPTALKTALMGLNVPGWDLTAADVSRNGIGAIDVTVVGAEEDQGHGRHLSDIEEILNSSQLSERVRTQAMAIFTRLAEAEARIHQTTVDRIHFHEVGAVDAIVDIVGACIGLEMLEIDRITCSAIPISHGFTECMHGVIPIPAPATMELLKGIPTYPVDVRGEIVTPTGAAIVSTLAEGFGRPPAMTISITGYGAGKKEFGDTPNLLRLTIGEELSAESAGMPEVVIIEANIDDMSPQLYDVLFERLLAAGAADVTLTPIIMKKGRPAIQLSTVCSPASVEKVSTAIFRETTTLGVRYYTAKRNCLERRWETVTTKYGDVRIKIGSLNGEETSATPEYEDVRTAAEAAGVPLKSVQEAAVVAYRSLKEP